MLFLQRKPFYKRLRFLICNMNKLIILSTALLLSVFASAQPDDAKNLQQTARSFMQTGDFNNAIIVLNRALQTDKNNLELLKDLAMTYYLKQDYTKSYEVVKQIVDCDDADVQVYQIAGNVYRAIEMVKEWPPATPCASSRP